MTSDTERRLDEINRKLQILIENSDLAKFDLMFSVLVSLTIFGAGLVLTNFRLEKNAFSISLQAFFPVLVYTLIGEAYSILKDELAIRFGFWLVLVSNFILFGFLLLFASILTFLGSNFVLPFFPLFYALVLYAMSMFNRYLRFFWRYMTRFPTRFPNLQETYGRETRKLLKPMMLGFVVYFATFLILVAYLILVTI